MDVQDSIYRHELNRSGCVVHTEYSIRHVSDGERRLGSAGWAK
jgi:hypothetical protein